LLEQGSDASISLEWLISSHRERLTQNRSSTAWIDTLARRVARLCFRRVETPTGKGDVRGWHRRTSSAVETLADVFSSGGGNVHL
jgi:hypothetical protein